VDGLASLVGVSREQFAADHWGRRPLLTRSADRPGAPDLFGPAAVDELLSTRALRTPFIRMAKDGRTLDPATYTLGGGVGAGITDQVSEDRVLRLFSDGATIVLQALHRTWEPVVSASQAIAADLGHPVQVNAYVTPPQNQGFDDHYDVHDVFVVQVAGDKQWRVRPPVHQWPLRDQPWTDRRDAVLAAAEEPPVVDEVLSPGDCLYVPRGWLHSATALGRTSIHLTIGVHVWTQRHLADDLLRAAGRRLDDDPAVRAALPVGVDPLDPRTTSELRARVRAAVDAALDAVPDDELAALLATRVRAAQRAEPLRVMGQHAAAGEPTTTWRPRLHLAPRWEGRDPDSPQATLVTRVGRVVVPPDQCRAVDAVLTGEARAEALGDELRRALCLAGVLVPEELDA
jgi:lysine-specific demethylase/histidyl-hydroxylase NO66